MNGIGQNGMLSRQVVARLLVRDQGMLRAYVSVVLRDKSLVDDVLQETAVLIMERAEADTDIERFSAWVRGVARRVALSFARKHLKMRTVDTEVLDAIDAEWGGVVENLITVERKTALQECMKRLPEWGRKLLRMRYEREMKTGDIAAEQNRSLNGVYVGLSKIHKALSECVRRCLTLKVTA